MASKALLDQLNHQKNIVDGVLNTYLQTHPCPCAWSQFAYWVSKARPKGSYDIIQNFLVEAALSLPTYHQQEPSTSQYWLEAEVSCSVCGMQWLYFCEEWRMLGYYKQLVPLDAQGLPITSFPPCLAGEMPAPGFSQSLEEWVLFMQKDMPGRNAEERSP